MTLPDASVSHAGIIAAGDGTRLAATYPRAVKPLIPVAGRPLCHWVAASLHRAGIREITVLHNNAGHAMRSTLESAFPQLRWTFLQADTASSWESFRLVCRSLSAAAERFIVSTVDALVLPQDARDFARRASAQAAVAGLALTDYVDDEKPLWAELREDGFVTALGDDCPSKRWVTSGLYYMTRPAAELMPEPQAFPSLRRYLASLVESGARVAGYPLSKTLDIDRPADVVQAEGFLKEAVASW